ncbi:hypothetical protein TL16_g04979 [Triparma laevis f. inornata]|uniref:Uncharacterized protein n=1 Tax=Triparma laevis f. inornata TaxID=1714386 RepID=A0A9W7AIZ8_9STRA|nr:hypothetical protein TL16_g04979 [Triparma laevis f. inornata]
MGDSSQQIWEEFQSSFLAKLYSADFHHTLDEALANTTNNATPHHHLLKTVTGGKPAQQLAGNKTFQRRRSKTREELRNMVDAAAVATPRHGGGDKGGGDKGDPKTPGFFMTEGPEGDGDGDGDGSSPHHSPQHSPRRRVMSFEFLNDETVKNFNLLPLTAVPENIKQNMALRQTTETQIRVAGVEKRKPIPVQYNRLRDLLDRLRSSHEEHHAFFAQVDQIVKNRSSQHLGDKVTVNREKCGDGSLTKEARLDRLAEIGVVREERLKNAKQKLGDLTKKRLEHLVVKLEFREMKRREEQAARERLERQMCWAVVLKLGHHANKSMPKFEKERKERTKNVKEKVLANKIISMWKFKKAPTEGQKYRKAVMKLRSFIKSKTSRWKNTQKTRAGDLIVLFLQEHRRANLPIVVANFIHGVKVWQRWWRNYEGASNNRIKALLIMWDEIESEWFSEEELRLTLEAEKKKEMEANFDLEKIFGDKEKQKQNQGVYRQRSTRSPKPGGSPRVKVFGAGNNESPTSEGPGSAFSPKLNRSVSSPRKKKISNAASPSPNVGGASHRKLTPRANNNPSASSPRASKPLSPRRNTSRRTTNKLNTAQTSLIIDMRLQKDLKRLRSMKPTLLVKKVLLKQKLREIRYTYKVGLPGYLDMLNLSDVSARKVYTNKDVINLLNTKSNVFIAPKEELLVGRRKKSKFPKRSKSFHMFTSVTRDVMKLWVSEACQEQEKIIKAREQRLIDISKGIVVDTGAGAGEKEKEVEMTPAPSPRQQVGQSLLNRQMNRGGERLKKERRAVNSISLISQLTELKGVGGRGSGFTGIGL